MTAPNGSSVHEAMKQPERMTDVAVAKHIAEDFQTLESREMPLFAHERDVELVRHALRCLANQDNGWSVEVMLKLGYEVAL